jgi:hypothetical protein
LPAITLDRRLCNSQVGDLRFPVADWLITDLPASQEKCHSRYPLPENCELLMPIADTIDLIFINLLAQAYNG